MNSTQARQNISYAFDTYMPGFTDDKAGILRGFDELLPLKGFQYAYETCMNSFVYLLGADAGKFPGYVPTISDAGSTSSYISKLPPDLLVSVLYPSASADIKTALVNQINAGTLSRTDFTSGLVAAEQTTANPSLDQIKQAIPHFDGSGLPSADLSFSGITAAQADFLVGVYVASFNRAPDFAGLNYWAHDLATFQAQGTTPTAAIQQLTANMYKAGSQNGEKGSSMSNGDYVNYLYNNVLGRGPDAAGQSWWVNDLNNGSPRDNFLATYLQAALEHQSDAAFVQARISVAKYAAQINRDGGSVDLSSILSGVTDASTALTKIESLQASMTKSAEIDTIALTGIATDHAVAHG